MNDMMAKDKPYDLGEKTTLRELTIRALEEYLEKVGG